MRVNYDFGPVLWVEGFSQYLFGMSQETIGQVPPFLKIFILAFSVANASTGRATVMTVAMRFRSHKLLYRLPYRYVLCFSAPRFPFLQDCLQGALLFQTRGPIVLAIILVMLNTMLGLAHARFKCSSILNGSGNHF